MEVGSYYVTATFITKYSVYKWRVLLLSDGENVGAVP